MLQGTRVVAFGSWVTVGLLLSYRALRDTTRLTRQVALAGVALHLFGIALVFLQAGAHDVAPPQE